MLEDNLTVRMECFTNPCDIFSVLIWQIDCRSQFGKERALQNQAKQTTWKGTGQTFFQHFDFSLIRFLPNQHLVREELFLLALG